MDLNILFWNCQGIRPKRKELELYLKENVIDIIALTETFLNKKLNFHISGYDTIGNDRSTGQRGGLAFFVKHGLVIYKEYRNFSIITSNEALAINLDLSNNQNITLATIYCPNGNPHLSLFQAINNLSDNVMFVEDFNSKLESFGCAKRNTSGPMLQNIQNQLNLIYLNNNEELWITFYDIEKCFDRLWLEDCINSLWRCSVDDDILYLIYLLNRKPNIIVRTPFGNTQSFEIFNLVKQGTVLGPILNNCSLDGICSEGHGHNMGTVEIKTLEFVDDIADPNNGYFEALKSNQTISFIQKRKRLTFSAEKCKILKINSTDNSSSLFLSGIKLEADPQFRYLGDIFNNKGSNSSLCENRAQKATGSSNEIISLCKESILGNT